MESKELGKRGEEAAAAFLQRKDMEIVEQNWKCSYGEVDIIALDGDTLVFCEVKTRRCGTDGIAEYAVNEAKQRRYSRIARVFTARTDVAYQHIRFDVIAIYAFSEMQALLRYVRNAFEAVEA